MVDIHCHILPGLDDGAQEDSIACQMAGMAASDGITHIVATPHANYQFQFDPEVNRRKREHLQKAIGPRPVLLPGCDFHLSYENIESARVQPERYTINGTQYLLVEFADLNIPANITQIFSEMVSRRLFPVITHPERNPILCARPQPILEWIQAGCWVQITAGSLLGKFGKRAQRAAERLLRHGMVHFLATDAHNVSSRPPLLSEGRSAIAAVQGEEVARALCEDNPRAAIEGRELPWRPEPQPIPVPPRKWFLPHR